MSTEQRAAIIQRLRAQLSQVAAGFGSGASGLSGTDIIPDAEIIDSAGLLEFVVWYE